MNLEFIIPSNQINKQSGSGCPTNTRLPPLKVQPGWKWIDSYNVTTLRTNNFTFSPGLIKINYVFPRKQLESLLDLNRLDDPSYFQAVRFEMETDKDYNIFFAMDYNMGNYWLKQINIMKANDIGGVKVSLPATKRLDNQINNEISFVIVFPTSTNEHQKIFNSNYRINLNTNSEISGEIKGSYEDKPDGVFSSRLVLLGDISKNNPYDFLIISKKPYKTDIPIIFNQSQ